VRAAVAVAVEGREGAKNAEADPARSNRDKEEIFMLKGKLINYLDYNVLVVGFCKNGV